MNSHRRRILFFFLSCTCCFHFVFGQQIDLGIKNYKTSIESPYHLDLKKDLIVSGASVALIGTAYYLRTLRTPLDSAQLLYPDISKIPSFDLSAIHNYDQTYVTASDVLLYTAVALPFISFFDKRVSGHAPQIIAMYLETLAINEAIHSMTTVIANRRRPYTFNTDSSINSDGIKVPEVPFSVKEKKGNLNSYFSGHTSTATAATFFGARIFTDFRPHSKLVPFVWTAAALVPAFTGFARVKAGKHFPSDVVTGYAVGAAIGYLVPTLHKIKNKNLSFAPALDGQGLYMSYNF
ncbi:MAG: phosphatase PAP2 family protein [Chitinophagales bacterium]